MADERVSDGKETDQGRAAEVSKPSKEERALRNPEQEGTTYRWIKAAVDPIRNVPVKTIPPAGYKLISREEVPIPLRASRMYKDGMQLVKSV